MTEFMMGKLDLKMILHSLSISVRNYIKNWVLYNPIIQDFMVGILLGCCY